jgi:Fur family transcriptional regulator, peroxide stress response regulator
VTTLRARGRKVTAQRMAVFHALEGAEDHPTAEDVYARLRSAVPGLALKTVYAILHELAALRLVEPIPMSARATRWEPNTAPHTHFVCDVCGRLLDLPVDPTVLLSVARRSNRRVRMTRTLLLVHGQCERCGGLDRRDGG